MIPVSLIIFIYFKIVRYVHEMSKNVTSVNILTRAQRELKMIRRIVILVLGLTTIGLPYAVLVFLSFFTSPPKYDFRIAYVFVDVSLAFVMGALFKFTEPLRMFIGRKVGWRTNVVTQART
jgi:hypothetical protein